MGKLHTLRRAIERDPEAYRHRAHFRPERWWPRSASFWQGQWHPSSSWYGSYKAFVRHVLEEIDDRSE